MDSLPLLSNPHQYQRLQFRFRTTPDGAHPLCTRPTSRSSLAILRLQQQKTCLQLRLTNLYHPYSYLCP
ncbi:hypothetical protein FRX31_022955 [Thalictrum thalictroides]|uniref:Uncharacterized protein n=1 Tax=Thalictrum thalictroides TaxID=46969 RepID=A0A7J6VTF4_THATH|nr:hypothetical protein FRX31_022955 [Thalictrum thalictroides]